MVNLYNKTAQIIKHNRIKHMGTSFTSQNMRSDIFEIAGTGEIHEVRLWDVKLSNGQIIHKTNCTCMWASLHPNNFLEGEQICRHIKEVLNFIKND